MSDFRPALIVAVVITIAGTQGSAQSYAAHRNGDVLQLQDARTETIISILPSAGNIAFEMKVKGQNILYWPYGRSTIWRLERLGAFPKHHRISLNAVAWVEQDVFDWMRAKASA